VSDDVERSRLFYTDMLAGEVVLEGEPTIVALINGWSPSTSVVDLPGTSRV
jgi:hypothetical protein